MRNFWIQCVKLMVTQLYESATLNTSKNNRNYGGVGE